MWWPFGKKEPVIEVSNQRNKGDPVTMLLQEIAGKLNIMELYIEDAIDMIAKTIAKSEFRVVKSINGKLDYEKKTAYYRLNIRPNGNETGFVFWRKVIRKLFTEDEALIIIFKDGSMYLADSFSKGNEVIMEKTFRNVRIEANGDYLSLNRTFKMNEVIYLENRNDKARNLIQKFNEMMGDMFSVAMKSYRNSNLSKYKVQFPGTTAIKDHKTGKVISTNEYLESIKQKFNSDDIEILMQNAGMQFDEFKMSPKNGDDLSKFVDVVMNSTAFAFDIPVDVFIGKTTEKSNAMNDFITFAVEPVMEILEDGLNATGVNVIDYLEGERIEINRTRIKHYDVLDVANGLDKLYAIGFSYNSLMDLIGMNRIDEPWADEHHITKNYTEYSAAKGGDS